MKLKTQFYKAKPAILSEMEKCLLDLLNIKQKSDLKIWMILKII